MILAGDRVSSIVHRIVEALLTIARTDTDDDIRLACAMCLGELGAVDPTRLSNRRVVHFEAEDEQPPQQVS